MDMDGEAKQATAVLISLRCMNVMNIARLAPGVPLEFLEEIGVDKLHDVNPCILHKLRFIGGGGFSILKLSKAMVRYDCYTELILPMPFAGVYEVSNRLRVRFVKAKYFKPFSPSDPLPFFSPCLLRGIDLIHIHQFRKALSNFSCIYGKMLGKPIFVTDHGGGGLAFDYGRLVDCFLTVSKYSAKMFIQYRKRIHIIYNGVDLTDFEPKPEANELRLKLLGNSEGIILLYVGMVRAHKRIKDLIKAFSLLKRRYDRLKLVICGGILQPDYHAYIRAIIPPKFKKDIIFTGYVKKHAIPFYQASDIFVFPSSHELLGQVLLEAMAARKPVVASNVGGVPEVVIDGKTGFLVKAREWRKSPKPGVVSINELTEKVRILIEDLDLRRRMGEEGRKRVEKIFTLDRVAERVLNAYKEFI